MTEPTEIKIDNLREKLNLIVKWLSNESLLKVDRPDLYAEWIDYKERNHATALNNTQYDRMLNMWLLHYFLVHGKK